MAFLEIPNYPDELTIPVPAAGKINLGASPTGFWAVLSNGTRISLQGGVTQEEYDALEARVTTIEGDLSGYTPPLDPGMAYLAHQAAAADVSLPVTGNINIWTTILTCTPNLVLPNQGNIWVFGSLIYNFTGDEDIEFRGLLNGAVSTTFTNLGGVYSEALQSQDWGGVATAQTQKTVMHWMAQWSNLVAATYTLTLQLRYPAAKTLNGTFTMNQTTHKDQFAGCAFWSYKETLP